MTALRPFETPPVVGGRSQFYNPGVCIVRPKKPNAPRRCSQFRDSRGSHLLDEPFATHAHEVVI